MASEDCVLSFRTSGSNYRTKQMASGDARDLWVTSQQIGTQSLKNSSEDLHSICLNQHPPDDAQVEFWWETMPL